MVLSPSKCSRHRRLAEGARDALGWPLALACSQGLDRHGTAPCTHLWGWDTRKRERVQCSALVDWPVYPLAHTTRASIDAQCGLSGPPDQLVDLARKNRRLAGDSKLVDDGGFTPLGSHTAARLGPRLLCGWFCGVPRGPPQLTKETQMLRKFIIGLMKALLDVVILVSLIGGVIVIGVTAANAGGYAPPLVIAEAIIGACALVAVFGVSCCSSRHHRGSTLGGVG